MTIPVKFRRTAPRIVTYDYADETSATGWVIYYGAEVNNGAGTDTYTLIRTPIYSDKITTFASVGQALAKWFDKDFDYKFEAPQEVRGNMIISIPLGVGRISGDSGGILTTYIIGKVYHYDGTTETLLDSFTSSSLVVDDTTYVQNCTMVSTIAVIALKRFNKGDTLRVNIEGWASINSAHNRKVGIGHDPKSRDDPGTSGVDLTIKDSVAGTYGETAMEVHVPFRIDT